MIIACRRRKDSRLNIFDKRGRKSYFLVTITGGKFHHERFVVFEVDSFLAFMARYIVCGGGKNKWNLCVYAASTGCFQITITAKIKYTSTQHSYGKN
jgi:hypothetical protein